MSLHRHCALEDQVKAVAYVVLLVDDLVLGEFALLRMLDGRPHKVTAWTFAKEFDLFDNFAECFDKNGGF